jgi:prepilin-type N-terminal cleavage/methylation domain-containing protein
MLTVRLSPARRAGFTLIELLIVMILLSLVSGVIVTLLLRQQRFYNSTSEVIETRQQIRQATAVLPPDLRGISSSGSDIYVMTDSSLEFRSTFGTGTVCLNTVGKSNWVSTVPVQSAKGSALTSWSAAPVVGDSVAILDEGANANVANDDLWGYYQISAVSLQTGNNTSGCPVSSGLVVLADLTAGNPSYQLTFTTAQTKTIVPGTGMRFFRRVHYSLYRAADNNWYLGYYDCLTGRVPVCNNIQPIAGPFQAYANDATSGLQFSYFDSTGTALAANAANRPLVARISVVARGQGKTLINLTGSNRVVFQDSVRVDVGLRNRK